MARVLNFGPGPSMLPESVLKRMQAELLDYHGCGWSIVEASHRGTEVQALMRDLRAAVRDLLAIPDNYDILFCQGGGRLQFAMVPMNLLGASPVASYLVTGTWSKTAAKEAMRFAKTQLAFSGNGTRLPVDEEIDIVEGAAYCYYCDNETIHGLEFPTIPEPDLKGAPLVADMSSNFMSRPIDVERFGLFWAAAQNNLGIAGLTVVVIRRDLLGLASSDVPTLMNYGVYSRTSSIPNTPPVFQLYAAKLMAEWIEKEGGRGPYERKGKGTFGADIRGDRFARRLLPHANGSPCEKSYERRLSAAYRIAYPRFHQGGRGRGSIQFGRAQKRGRSARVNV